MEPIAGGITEVKNAANNLEINNLARFAVDEHNKKASAHLEFVKVVKAEQQVVKGMMYYVTLEAKDGTDKKSYYAKVVVHPWMDPPKELLEFNPIIGDAPAEPCA